MSNGSSSGFGVDRFGWTDEALAELGRRRGWTEAAVEVLELRYDVGSSRVGFPIRDQTGDELGFVAYTYDPQRRNGRPKMQQPAGVPRQLFPPPETLGDEVREVVLTEGEPDQVAATSHGFHAVGVPGTQSWHEHDAARFTGRRWRVYVVFDCDEPGRQAAAAVAGTLIEAGVDARLVDLDPSRDDGYDLTDFLLDHGRDALEDLLEAAELYRPAGAAIIEPLRAFLERPLPAAESLVGVARAGTNLLPRYGWVLPWGREGSGKTSVLLDLLFHAAAGVDWLHYTVARPLRVVIVINEGVPGGLQDKLAQKLDAWDGDRDAVLDNLAIYASPWGAFTFRNEALVEHARAYALDFGADYVAFDPLHTLGATGAGSPQDTEAFKNELRAFGLWQDLGVITAHHSNKAGMVSGDWARHADTVLHLEKDGKNPATKVTLDKARPADPTELGVPAILEWVVETMSYTRKVLDPAEQVVSDEALLARIVEHLGEVGPLRLGELQTAVKGDKDRLADVAKAALATGELVNIESHAGWYRFTLPSATGGKGEIDPNEAQTRMDTEVYPPVAPTGGNNLDAARASQELLPPSPPSPWKGEGGRLSDKAYDEDELF